MKNIKNPDPEKALVAIMKLIECTYIIEPIGLDGNITNITIHPQVPELIEEMGDDNDNKRFYDISDFEERKPGFKEEFRKLIVDLTETEIEVDEISIIDCGADSEEDYVYIRDNWTIFHDKMHKSNEFLWRGRPAFCRGEYPDVIFIGPDPYENDGLSPEIVALREWKKYESITTQRIKAAKMNGFTIPYKNYQNPLKSI